MTEREFWANTAKPDSPPYCWEWRGATDSSGYGAVKWDGRKVNTHRVAWSLKNGGIPAGLWILHRCDNRLCINPAHLFVGTPTDNARDCIEKGRSWSQALTHCKRGHPLTGPTVNARNGVRVCRVCKQITQRERYRRNPARILEVNRIARQRRKEKRSA